MTTYMVPNKNSIFHNLTATLFPLSSVSVNNWKLAVITSYPGNII